MSEVQEIESYKRQILELKDDFREKRREYHRKRVETAQKIETLSQFLV